MFKSLKVVRLAAGAAAGVLGRVCQRRPGPPTAGGPAIAAPRPPSWRPS